MARVFVARDESLGREIVVKVLPPELTYAFSAARFAREIKPETILLSEGTAVVTDFGIAKAIQAARKEMSPEITQPGDFVGTPMYMSPEQAASDPATDQRADIYAWGVVAYELISGKHPFAGHTTPQDLLAAQMSDTPRPLTDTNSRLPRANADLIMRCLSKRA